MAQKKQANSVSKSSKKNNGQTTPINVLYVVFHGFISLCDYGQEGFIAHVLDMGEDHAYLYGDWLSEHPIPKRQPGQSAQIATLKSVDSYPPSDCNTMNSDNNVIIGLPDVPDPSHPFVRAILNLPRPKCIYDFISGTLNPAALQGTKEDIEKVVGSPTAVSGVRVFEYTFKDITQVKVVVNFGGEVCLWQPPEPADVCDKNLKVSVFHVYDEPLETFPSTADAVAHNLTEFNNSMSFLGVNITLVKEPVQITNSQPLPGLLEAETITTLDKRQCIILELLNKVRSGGKVTIENRVLGGGGGGGQVCSGGHATVSPTMAQGKKKQ